MTYGRIAQIVTLGFLIVLLIAPPVTSAQVLQLAELNTEQIRSLDRARTIVLIPGGILEQHGPFLPSFTDGYRNERTTEELARAVAARPGWTALILPTIPLGVGGANELGGDFSFPGTYAVRYSTLLAVFVDLASELGEQGFRWIFVTYLHGAARHHQALDDAGGLFPRHVWGPNGESVRVNACHPGVGARPGSGGCGRKRVGCSRRKGGDVGYSFHPAGPSVPRLSYRPLLARGELG